MLTGLASVSRTADFRSIVVEVDVPEARLGLVQVHGPCEIVLDAYPGRRFRGETTEIGRRVNRSTAAVPVRVRFTDQSDQVLPDMSAHVSFLREELTAEQAAAASYIVVPSRAVIQRGGRDVVFVIDHDEVTERPVHLGQRTEEGIVLIDGPDEGARVVLDPPSTLASGQRVKEREE